MDRKLAIAWMLFIALGCNQEAKQKVYGSDGNGNPGSKPVTSDKLTNVTNTSQCIESGHPSPEIEGSWAADFTRGQVEMRQVFSLRGNHTVVNKLTCTYAGKSVTVMAQAAAAITANQILILSNGSDEKTFHDGKTTALCSISLKDGEVIEYAFQGPCLHLTSQIRDIVMIPETSNENSEESL